MRKLVRESWLILLLGVLFAVLLGGVQTGLAPQIAANQASALNEAIREVVPDAAKTEFTTVPGYDRRVCRCVDSGGRPCGWAVEAVGTGFADKIRLVVGLSPDCAKITGLRVIENVETPGLGNKIADDEWEDQYRGLDSARPVAVQKRPPAPGENGVQAVTGATISSKAVTDIVNRAIARVRAALAAYR